MMTKNDDVTLKQIFAMLNAAILKAGGVNAFAQKNRIHHSTVSKWANTDRNISDRLLDILGLEKVTVIRRKKPLRERGTS
ncbi:MAG: hypothetical protein ABF839_06975 [Acetobacter orientalis]|uniref:hypothetical protein n=1 Tax=Acetobacter orientalis TaxID=146474 RepID=UPI0039EBC233